MSTLDLLTLHLIATCTVFGILLVVQVVHYPLFALVGREHFQAYEQVHIRLISYVVVVPMLLELTTGAWLVVRLPPEITPWILLLGIFLIAVFWLSTMVLQGPINFQLADGFDSKLHRKLVSTNWIRTITSGVRVIVVAYMLYTFTSAPSVTV